ncbi:MAG TPA: SRPBCC family protein [Micromonosporaceae bacterium]
MTSPTESLHLRVRTDADPDTVYKALTDADELTEWFAESAEVDLGRSRYQFWGRYAPQGDRPRQTLLGHQPGRGLRFTWAFDEGPATVEISLAPDGEGSLVTLSHDGSAEPVALKCFWYVTLANLAAFSEGRQTMPPFDFSVPAQGDALVRTVIDAPAEEVYAALLDSATVSKVAGGPATVEATVGGRYDVGWPGYGPDRIVELDPDKVLAYSWRNHGGAGESLVRWSLRGSRGATYLTLVHSGIDDDALAERYRQGWPPYLVELKRLLELGSAWQPLAG